VLTRLRRAAAWRLRAAWLDARLFPHRLAAWAMFRRGISRYQVLDEAAVVATRKSDTVFVFGSGASLNDISPAGWRAMEAHDTIGFNWFVHQKFLRCDYHLLREVGPTDLDPAARPRLREYCDLIRTNPNYASTVLLVQTGFRATNGHLAIGLGLLPPDRRIFLWRSLRDRTEPSRSLTEGLAHQYGTLEECVNFAALMGWTTIVIAGVDLYDRRYFWLGTDEPVYGDTTTAGLHNLASSGLVSRLGKWRADFAARGIDMFVHNPNSLLAQTVPVWRGTAARPSRSAGAS
jgi:hypothetical protein